MAAMHLFVEGALSALSPLILPYLPTLIIYNIAEALGNRKILSRIFFYPTGVLLIFQLSVYLLSVFPSFFIANALKIDIFYGLLMLYLGYIISRKKLALVIRAAREMTPYWYIGSFLIGATMGAIWVNHLSVYNLQASLILEDALLTSDVWVQMSEMTFFAGGMVATILLVALLVFFIGSFFSDHLVRMRDLVRIPCGLIFIVFAIYILLRDLQVLLAYGG